MNSKNKWLVICLLLITYSLCATEIQIDSLIKKSETASVKDKPTILNQIATELVKIKPEEALQYANSAEANAWKVKNSFEEANAKKIKGAAYINLYRYPEAIETLNAALELFIKNNLHTQTAETYCQLGLASKNTSKYEHAYQYYNKALSFYELAKNKNGIANTNNLIGSLYYKQSNFTVAIKQYEQALLLLKELNDNTGMALVYSNIAIVHRDKGNYQDALNNLTDALLLYETNKNKPEQANVLNIVGGIYQRMNKNLEAVSYYKRSLAIREELNLKADMAASYGNLGKAYSNLGENQKALECLLQSLKIRKETGDKKAIAAASNNLGSFYLKTRNYNQALGFYLESLKYCMELDDKVEIALVMRNIGNIYFEMNSLETALDYYEDALSKLKDSEDQLKLLEIYHLIGNAYSKLNQFEKALENYNLSLEIRESIGDIASIASSYNSIGNVYNDNNDFTNARKYYNKALDKFKKQADKVNISLSLNNLGNLCLNEGNKASALNYYKEALQVANEVKFKYNVALCSRKIAEILIAQNNGVEALNYLENSISIGTETGNLEILKQAYKVMYKYYELNNECSKTLKFYTLFTKVNDSINQSMTNKKLLDLQLGFELRKNEGKYRRIENDIKALKAEKEKREAEIIHQRTFVYLLLILAILLLAIGIMFFSRYQLKNRTAKMLHDKIAIIEKVNQNLKASEDELKKLNSTKDKFFSIIAHDIKNPLGGVMGMTHLLKQGHTDMPDEEKMEMYDIINKSANQLHNLLDNLLQWSRAQSGRVPYNPAPINLYDIVENNIELQKANIDKKSIVALNLTDNNIKILADPDMVTLVIRNLLSNAIKFTPEKGKIKVTTQVKHHHVEIAVEDNGVGIAKDDINKLFRIDSQFTTVGTNKETGTGLGLILCKEFITKHNGKIWVESEITKGSRFVFTLPLV